MIWDEVIMTYEHAFEVVGRLFRDVCKNDEIFGGKFIA